MKIIESKRDYSRWAKKFDKVAHLYKKNEDGSTDSGTECGSVAHCLGNNYALVFMKTCQKCKDIRNAKKESVC